MRRTCRGLGLWLKLALTAAAVGVPLAAPLPAVAQSDADRATARRLALDGIDLFKAKKYREALDKLGRAQALFDAPVHLIHIARAHAQLGEYVEAAEAYRKLARTKLGDNPPQAFKDAVEDGKKELPEIEPKIASLRIEIQPAQVKALELEIDGVAVSSAVVGVDRPTNPGTRTVKIKAPGYKSVERTVELQPGAKVPLAVTLEVDESAPVSPPVPGGDKPAGGDGKQGTAGAAAGAGPEGNVGFLVGVRLAGTIPTGDIAKGVPMKDFYTAGSGAELRGGVRLFKKYTPLLFAGGYILQAGREFEDGPGGSTTDTTPSLQEAGVGFMYAADPGKLGPFGEIDLAFVHRIQAERSVSGPAVAPKNPCDQTATAVGGAVRLVGGAQIPLASWFQLSPFLGLSFGQFTSTEVNQQCTGPEYDELAAPFDGSGNIDEKGRATHLFFTLGVGGDLLFGSDR